MGWHSANKSFLVFSLSRMRTYDGHYLAVSLVKNHELVVALYSDKDARNVMDSQSVMLELVPGDLIYLALGPSDQYAYYSDKNNLSTFTGFLLYKKSWLRKPGGVDPFGHGQAIIQNPGKVFYSYQLGSTLKFSPSMIELYFGSRFTTLTHMLCEDSP